LAYKMIKAPFITATGDAEFGIWHKATSQDIVEQHQGSRPTPPGLNAKLLKNKTGCKYVTCSNPIYLGYTSKICAHCASERVVEDHSDLAQNIPVISEAFSHSSHFFWHIALFCICYWLVYLSFLWHSDCCFINSVLLQSIVLKNNLKLVLKKLKTQLEILSLNDVYIPVLQ
jgi:hypothetical protein